MVEVIKYMNKYIVYVFSAVVFIYLFIMNIFFGVTGDLLIKFIAMNIFGILLPGWALLGVCGVRLSKITAFLYAYILGYAYIVLEYFISELFDRRVSFVMIMFFSAFMSAKYIYHCSKANKYVISFEHTKDEWITLFFWACYLLLSVLTYSAVNLNPDVAGRFTTIRDMQFWCSNTVALKVDFPGSKLFMMGNDLRYHYFSGIPIAFLSSIFDIDVFTLSFTLYSFTKAVFMVGALFFMLEKINCDCKNKFWIGILLLFTTGIESKSMSTFVHHSMLAPFGFDIAFALGICFCVNLILQWKEKKFSYPLWGQVLLLWFFCVGAKAPLASVLLLFPGLLCLYWLIEKDFKKSLFYGICILLIFILINKCCIMESGNYNWNNRLGLYELQDIVTVLDSEFLNSIYIKAPFLAAFIAIIAKCFLLNPAYLVVLVCLVLYTALFIIKGKLECKTIYLWASCLICVGWGTVLWICVDAGGYSEMYFAMASFIPAVIFITLSIGAFYKNNTSIKGKRGFYVLFALILTFGVYSYLFIGYNGTGVMKKAMDGIYSVYLSRDSVDDSNSAKENEVCLEDIKALEWLRDNTERKAVILSDKAIILDNASFYLYGIFSERQQYLEGTSTLGAMSGSVHEEITRRKELIKAFYNNEDGAYEQIKKEGVKYVIQTTDITPYFKANNEKFELMFSSETCNIYEIR